MEICDTCKHVGWHSPNCIRKRYGLPAAKPMQHKCRLRLKQVTQHVYIFQCLGDHEVRMNKFAVRRAVLGTSRL